MAILETKRSPGLVVMCDDSCSKRRGFESRRHIQAGHLEKFSHRFVVKIVCLKRPKINEKEAIIILCNNLW